MFAFFFQAEDGIRDGHVTGVQTCALPILRRVESRPSRQRHDFKIDFLLIALIASNMNLLSDMAVSGRGKKLRSEERRVGKEWRGRGGQYRYKERKGNRERTQRRRTK